MCGIRYVSEPEAAPQREALAAQHEVLSSWKTAERCSGWVDRHEKNFLFLRAPSLLIVQTQWSSASGPSLQSHTRTRHAAPRARPLPRPGGKEMRRRDSEGGATNTYGRVQLCATLPGVSHFPGQPRPCEAGKWRLPRTYALFAITPSPTAQSSLTSRTFFAQLPCTYSLSLLSPV